ncbi:hypothetical protein HMPREF3202_01972 [Prevotella bivia]|uniref:Uncharacterized protein n=1 Tax=Prevotella bivia TaxID=28125 RepID=A0A137SS27_9BACT|nr:hypothetical protein HMPREF3202_01972 [Prevotella bivia]
MDKAIPILLAFYHINNANKKSNLVGIIFLKRAIAPSLLAY